MDQMEQVEHLALEGNTKTSKARKWCLTWNNYNEDDYKAMEQWVLSKGYKYIIGKEKGTLGTPHLQIYIENKNPISWKGIKKQWPKCHIEQAKGNIVQNYNYCSKEGNAITNITVKLTAEEKWETYMLKTYNNVKWLDWQQSILDMIKNEPNERTVYWFWEEKGNIGKSFLCKYIDWKYDAIIANGKQTDVFNQYKSYLETKNDQPTIALIDIPRSHKDYVCYSTFEKIKDGLFYSGKYEGGKLRLTPHHLIIFANFEPEYHKLSIDRWYVKKINNSDTL